MDEVLRYQLSLAGLPMWIKILITVRKFPGLILYNLCSFFLSLISVMNIGFPFINIDIYI